MKISGKTLTRAPFEIVVIPRKDGDIVFKARPVTDFEPFEKLCPAPVPPTVMRKGNVQTQNVEDPKYKAAFSAWAEQRTNWMIIQSLQATDGLEWDGVKFDNPDTWHLFRSEFEQSGLTVAEISAIINTVVEACGLNQTKIEEATKRFLAGLEQA